MHSVAEVTAAITQPVSTRLEDNEELRRPWAWRFAEMQRARLLVGFDNRFGGAILAVAAANVLTASGVNVFYAGEATTGVLSAVRSGTQGRLLDQSDPQPQSPGIRGLQVQCRRRRSRRPGDHRSDHRPGRGDHQGRPATDCNHPDRSCATPAMPSPLAATSSSAGVNSTAWTPTKSSPATLPIRDWWWSSTPSTGPAGCICTASSASKPADRLIFLRDTSDPTFGGIAPEPSSENIQPVRQALADRPEPLKLGMIIDPDADRIRFTDGANDIDMNHFGATAYHYLHEGKGGGGWWPKLSPPATSPMPWPRDWARRFLRAGWALRSSSRSSAEPW